MTKLARPTMLTKLCEDPWSLQLDERRDLLGLLAEEQNTWLPRLRALVEPPLPDARFPAFLLATESFAQLAGAVAAARRAADLDTGTADELQRFVDLYRAYPDQLTVDAVID